MVTMFGLSYIKFHFMSLCVLEVQKDSEKRFTKKSSSSLSEERSSLSLVELDVVDAVDAMPATDGFLPPGVAKPPPTAEPQFKNAMNEFFTLTLLSSRRLPSRCRTPNGPKTKKRWNCESTNKLSSAIFAKSQHIKLGSPQAAMTATS